MSLRRRALSERNHQPDNNDDHSQVPAKRARVDLNNNQKPTVSRTQTLRSHSRVVKAIMRTRNQSFSSASAFDNKPPVAPKVELDHVFRGWERYSHGDIAHVIAYGKSTEQAYVLTGDTRSAHIQPSHRLVLVDWIVQVQTHLKLLPETLHRTLYLIDRYVHGCHIELNQYQLVGTVAFWIACKLEERWVPELSDLLDLTDNSYRASAALKCEREMLQALDFRLAAQTPITVARTLLDVLLPPDLTDSSSASTRQRVFYMLDLFALHHLHMERVSPTKQALAAVYLVCRLEDVSWSSGVSQLVQMSPRHVMPLVYTMAAYVQSDLALGTQQQLKGINSKYGKPRHGEITKRAWSKSAQSLLKSWSQLAPLKAQNRVLEIQSMSYVTSEEDDSGES